MKTEHRTKTHVRKQERQVADPRREAPTLPRVWRPVVPIDKFAIVLGSDDVAAVRVLLASLLLHDRWDSSSGAPLLSGRSGSSSEPSGVRLAAGRGSYMAIRLGSSGRTLVLR